MLHGTCLCIVIGFGLTGTIDSTVPLNKSFGAIVPQAASQSPRNSITGTVFDGKHSPVSQLRVELLNEVNSVIASARTDAVGRFRFTGLSQGDFQIRVITTGTAFIEQMERVTLRYSRGATGAHHEQIEINLRTKKGEEAAITNTGTTFAQEVPAGARKAYDRGLSLLDAGKNTDQGLAALIEALEIFPDYYLALERIGAEFVKGQQYEKARIALTRAITINPTGHLSLYALGVSDFHLRDYTEAIEHLRSALLLAPNSSNAPFGHFYQGISLIKTNKPVEAEAQLKRAYQMGGRLIPPDVHMHLAQLYSNDKRYANAADELELFLKEAPNAKDTDSIKNLIKQLRAKTK